MKTKYLYYILLLAIPVLLSEKAYDGVLYIANSKSVAQAGIVIHDNNMYIADNDEIVTYDLSAPATPAEVGRQYMTSGVDSIYLYDKYLVVARDEIYSSVYDISTPNNLTSAGITWEWSTCSKVTLYDKKAFVTAKRGYQCAGDNPSNSIRVYTFNDNSEAQYAGSIELPDVLSTTATVKTLYVSRDKVGLYVINTDNNNIVGTIDGRIYYEMKVAGTRLYCRSKGTLDCYDITSPQTPLLISQLQN